MCSQGTYNNDIFSDACKQCTNKPNNDDATYYTFNESGKPWTDSNCQYKCVADKGLTDVDENPSCLSNFELFVTSMGGEIVFYLCIAGAILVALTAVVLLMRGRNVKRKVRDSMKESAIGTSEDADEALNLQLAQADFVFSEQELYQHVCRIYFMGTNSPSKPWRVSDVPPA